MMQGKNSFRLHYFQLVRLYIGASTLIALDIITSSYGRYVSFTKAEELKFITKGPRRQAQYVSLPDRCVVRQLAMSGWGLLSGTMSFVKDALTKQAPVDVGTLPVECSVPDVFRLADKVSHHPKVVVVLGGLNDILRLYRENGMKVPKSQDGTSVVLPLLRRMIAGLRKIRAAYGEPYPFIFWVGFGRTKVGRMSRDLYRWMEKLESVFTKKVGSSFWPQWLYYAPVVRGAMLESLCNLNADADQLHWTQEEATRFGRFLNQQLEELIGDEQQNGSAFLQQELRELLLNEL